MKYLPGLSHDTKPLSCSTGNRAKVLLKGHLSIKRYITVQFTLQYSLHYSTVYITVQYTLQYSIHYSTVYITVQFRLQYSLH